MGGAQGEVEKQAANVAQRLGCRSVRGIHGAEAVGCGNAHQLLRAVPSWKKLRELVVLEVGSEVALADPWVAYVNPVLCDCMTDYDYCPENFALAVAMSQGKVMLWKSFGAVGSAPSDLCFSVMDVILARN